MATLGWADWGTPNSDGAPHEVVAIGSTISFGKDDGGDGVPRTNDSVTTEFG